MKTVGQLREEIMSRSLIDSDFRQRLLDDPASALRDDIGVALPDGFNIHVHEDNGVDAAHVVLPPPSQLSAEEMQQVAGACDDPNGVGTYAWDC